MKVMSLQVLQKYLPEGSIFFIEKWLKPYSCHIRITKKRNSKLGDYRYRSGETQQISINGDLEPQLFFFVLTHEIAHLITFSADRKILPHGKEWKTCYRNLLLESLNIYEKDFRPMVMAFSKTPKANYMATPEIVRYFSKNTTEDFIEDLDPGHIFEYQNQTFEILEVRKKRYICKNLHSGRKYLFRTCVQVKKLTHDD